MLLAKVAWLVVAVSEEPCVADVLVGTSVPTAELVLLSLPQATQISPPLFINVQEEHGQRSNSIGLWATLLSLTPYEPILVRVFLFYGIKTVAGTDFDSFQGGGAYPCGTQNLPWYFGIFE